MKTLVFSDTHLSHRFDQAQFELLRQQIEAADRVVINGDFWDQYLTTFDKFVKSDWRQLFPLLKQRQTIYIPGNHDMRDHLDERWQLFADRLEDRIVLQVGPTFYRIEHGHLHTYSFELKHVRIAKMFNRLYPVIDKFEHQGNRLTKFYLDYLRVKHFANDIDLRRFARQNCFENGWYIFGHSHTQKKDTEAKYLNPGMFRCGSANWLTLDEAGVSMLYSKSY